MLSLLDKLDRNGISMSNMVDKKVAKQNKWVDFDSWGVWIEAYGMNLKRFIKISKDGWT